MIVLLQLVVLRRIEGRRRTRVIAVMGVLWALVLAAARRLRAGPRHARAPRCWSPPAPRSSRSARRCCSRPSRRWSTTSRPTTCAVATTRSARRPSSWPRSSRRRSRARWSATRLGSRLHRPAGGRLAGGRRLRRSLRLEPQLPPGVNGVRVPEPEQPATAIGQHRRDRPATLLPVGPHQDRQHRRAEVQRVVLVACWAVGDRRAAARRPARRRAGGGRGAARPAAAAVAGRRPRGPAARRGAAPAAPRRRPPRRRSRAAPGRGPASRRCSRQATNWPSSLSETSCITPRPNCAGLPVIARSVTHLDVGGAAGRLGHRQRDLGAGGAVAALVLALGVDDEAVRRLVLLHERAGAVVDQRDRAELDLAPSPRTCPPRPR